MFFFKKKPIEIIACVNEQYQFVNEFAPIVPASNVKPSWWKNVDRTKFNWDVMDAETTVKSCPGIINSLHKGLIMPLWTDIAIKYDENSYRYQSSDRLTSVDLHPQHQSPGFYPNHTHLKISSPWIISTPVDLMYMSPFYHHPNGVPYICPPGIINPAGKAAGSNVFLFLERKKEQTQLLLEFGTPIMHIIPMTQEKYVFRTEVVSFSEFIKVESQIGGRNRFIARGLKNINFLKNKQLD
jgi:hypothetical protein